jgi:predicted AAA+ superfamily ATPase
VNPLQSSRRKALDLYRKYLCVGGMPEAVKNLAENAGDVLRFDRSILTDIRSGYLSDMTKYIETPLEASRIESVYRSIPAQLGNASGKFQYGKVRQGARARSYETALSWLVSSRMVYQCYRVSSPKTPLGGYLEEGYFKLFLNDAGLLADVVGARFDVIMLDRDFAYKGYWRSATSRSRLRRRGFRSTTGAAATGLRWTFWWTRRTGFCRSR